MQQEGVQLNLYDMSPMLSRVQSANDQFFGELLDFEFEEMQEYYDEERNNATD